ncbi:deoxyribonuclease-1-like 2 isoform X1 [Fundulus heteroclitus]|uniref:deoxyribonuclease-1-like 2 isoform X1 n=1 Tax=Fundulus heteroclitus TaxID=8078 RepID=UPI00165AB091|nr:deoxyribonuclease-1-like 2 isoform X1 [Fundulus heteroclitus]
MRGRSSNLCSLLLFSVFSLLFGAALVSGFRICSFNVNRFNSAKAAKPNVLHTLTKVVSKCDICLLQDVVDSDGKAVKPLLTLLNRWKSTRYDKLPYASVSSKVLGKSADNMQQYVFIYRRDIVNVTGQHQYEGNAFVRPPFVVQFYSNKTDIKEFILVPLHSEPEQAVQEIDSLYDVFEKVSEMWNNTNVMFLGDFHAGCAYVTRHDKKSIRLYTNSNFSWLIGDGVDTTVTDLTDCAYDRIVVHGQDFLKAIRPFSGKVFNFGKEFKLRRTKVLDVSDHYPIEVRLKGSAFLHLAPPLLILLGVSAIIQFFLPAL